ncbi:hypothetical protein AKJ38_02845 [candidate division MSBL1 archaeon SCGC-AAA259I14]|uniref:Ubiquinone biosynthesis protein UbiA n=1 Tax=candidate division MSBL1 archaeon SCGC-AAA259I14 TaxID=1698268 RepID=A0A133UR01_9EURY|nr:hypothetical protein AKJ38_02845 [candidate division MSBL1 archaeon SCGC-AAA259I14]
MKPKKWVLETRPQFLLLSPILAILGSSIAWHDGIFRLDYALLAFFALLLDHISVNTLNDYFDYRSGIDLETEKTQFSGGSGLLPSGSLEPTHVLWFGLACFFLAIPIASYLVMTSGWQLLPLILIGGFCVLLYTPFITKLPWPEWAPGAGLGSLPVLGFYFVQASSYPLHVIVASIPSGILVHNLLLLNELPDVEADKKKGRRKTLPIVLGKKKASTIYSVLTIAVYFWITFGAIANLLPSFCLLTWFTFPFALKAIGGAQNYEQRNELLSAMSNNVLVVLLTQLLLAAGYILAT